MATYETNKTFLSDDDFIYSRDVNGQVRSGGFSMNSLAFKNGLSPLSGGGEVNDTEFSQQFKNNIVPSFLHYQLAGYESSKELTDLLSTYNYRNENRSENYEDDRDSENDYDEQDGGGLYETLLNLVSVNKKPVKKMHSKLNQTKKQRLTKLNISQTPKQNSKKNRK